VTPPTPSDRGFLTEYAGRLRDLLAPTEESIANICTTRDLWLEARAAGGKVIFIGNGGSAAIAAHMAIDVSKNAGVRASLFQRRQPDHVPGERLRFRELDRPRDPSQRG
jgi:hypothetical protein